MESNIQSSDMEDMDDEDLISKTMLPEGTPDWGIRMVQILCGDYRSLSKQLATVEVRSDDNAKLVETVSKKLEIVEKKNICLTEENNQLKEKLLDLEYRQ